MWPQIREILIDCLVRLYEDDVDLFTRNSGRGLAERCIVFRLAHYLQREITLRNNLNEYLVDCDFNSSFAGNQQQDGKEIVNPDGTTTKRFVDIIVHRRAEDANSDFVCFEIKKWNNKTQEAMGKDRNNLRVLTTVYGYDYGFHIILGKHLVQTKIKVYIRNNNATDYLDWDDLCNLWI